MRLIQLVILFAVAVAALTPRTAHAQFAAYAAADKEPRAAAPAPPAYTIEGDRLTVAGVHLASVASPGSGQPELLEGLPLLWSGTTLAQGPRVAWRLPPGAWSVRAFVADASGVPQVTDWSVVVVPPHEPTRPERIAQLHDRYFAAWAEINAVLAALLEMEVTPAEWPNAFPE